MRFNEEFIKKNIPHAEILSTHLPKDYAFSIDTRTLKKNDIFVALQGNTTDGHMFVQQAVDLGAAGLIIESPKRSCLSTIPKDSIKNLFIILVPNTHSALIILSKAWRELFQGEVIGITGSVGKTSTKEFVARILALHSISHLVSSGNQNTKYGLAMNLLRLRPEHKVGVFEIGINKRGEMAQLADMARPTAACITNVGHCHMEGLGSIIDIAAEKRDIFKFFKEDSIGIVNGDIPLLAAVAYPHPVIKFGAKTTNQIQARKITVSSRKSTFMLKMYRNKYQVVLDKGHLGEVFNCLAAASIGYYLNIPDQTIVQALQQPMIVPGRFEEYSLKKGKGIIINDCYNANPESMKAALAAFEQIETDAQKIAVLGDMLELGVNSPFWHRQLGRFLRKVPSLRKVVLVGEMVKWTQKTIPIGVEVLLVPTWKEAVKALQEKLEKESLVLIKGSLGMKLGNIVDAFCK